MDSLTTPEVTLPPEVPSAWLLDCEAFAESIRPDPDLTVTAWADAYRILSPESSSEHGQWRTDRVPHAREIMDALSPSDPCTEVTFVAGTQVAKTEIGNNFIGAVIDVFGGPAMLVNPSAGASRQTSKTRLAKMIDSTPRLRAKISDNARDSSNSAMLKLFPGGQLALSSANSATDLKRMAVRWLFEDEVDEYPDDVDGQGPADALVEKRTDTYRDRKKIYRASTTTRRKSSKIWKHWKNSNQCERWVPCPHCAEYQTLRWEGFRWETRKVWEVARADDGVIIEVAPGTEGAQQRDTGDLLAVWYECGHCQGRIEERHKEQMLPAGRWIPLRPEVRHHKGFRLPSFYSPLGWYSWFEVVRDRLAADRDPSGSLLRLWLNTVAALPWDDTAENVSDIELKRRAAREARPYKLGMVPMGGWLLSGAVDVQGGRLEVKVKAWGRERESWLVDYQVIHGDTELSAPWEALDEYLQTRFRHECGALLPITAVGVDTGYRTHLVYEWCRPRRHRHILAMKGQSQGGKRVLGIPTDQDIDHNGRKIARGVKLWPIGADTAKSEIYARLKIEQAGPGCMHFPLGLPDEYYQGLVAERQATRYVKGYLRTIWEKDDGARNEPLDLEVYAYAAALYAGLMRVDWDRLEAGIRATASDLFVAAQRQAEERSDADAAPVQARAHAPDAGADAAPAALAPRPRKSNWVTGYRR
jgi:phage terminase large subunit GpA-like protein